MIFPFKDRMKAIGAIAKRKTYTPRNVKCKVGVEKLQMAQKMKQVPFEEFNTLEIIKKSKDRKPHLAYVYPSPRTSLLLAPEWKILVFPRWAHVLCLYRTQRETQNRLATMCSRAREMGSDLCLHLLGAGKSLSERCAQRPQCAYDL